MDENWNSGGTFDLFQFSACAVRHDHVMPTLLSAHSTTYVNSQQEEYIGNITGRDKNAGRPSDPSGALPAPSFRGPSPPRPWINLFTLATGRPFATFSQNPSDGLPGTAQA